MEVEFKSRKLQRTLNSEARLRRQYGPENAGKIMLRLVQLEAAPTLSDLLCLPQFHGARCHLLKGRLRGSYAVDLKHPWRLVFKPSHDPIPRKEDGSVDTSKITKITVTDITDYH